MLASSSSTSGAFPSTSEAHVRSHPAAPAPWCSLSAPLGTMACRKRGRPRLADPVASLPPSATPEERACAEALSEQRAKLSRRRKQARMATVQREVEALRSEHACLVAEHASWVAVQYWKIVASRCARCMCATVSPHAGGPRRRATWWLRRACATPRFHWDRTTAASSRHRGQVTRGTASSRTSGHLARAQRHTRPRRRTR